jgi:hypothetical protein
MLIYILKFSFGYFLSPKTYLSYLNNSISFNDL